MEQVDTGWFLMTMISKVPSYRHHAYASSSGVGRGSGIAAGDKETNGMGNGVKLDVIG